MRRLEKNRIEHGLTTQHRTGHQLAVSPSRGIASLKRVNGRRGDRKEWAALSRLTLGQGYIEASRTQQGQTQGCFRPEFVRQENVALPEKAKSIK